MSDERCICKDGVVVQLMGDRVITSRGESYVYTPGGQGMVLGPNSSATRCNSPAEMFGVVIAKHGGRQY